MEDWRLKQSISEGKDQWVEKKTKRNGIVS